jgi:hypothetical protein
VGRVGWLRALGRVVGGPLAKAMPACGRTTVTPAGATPTLLRVPSLDLSPPCGNPRLGLLGVSHWCSTDVGAAGLVRRWTAEGYNARRLGGVTSAWLTLQLSPWCWRSTLLCKVFGGNFAWSVPGGQRWLFDVVSPS